MAAPVENKNPNRAARINIMGIHSKAVIRKAADRGFSMSLYGAEG
jgi:hypothetical protein